MQTKSDFTGGHPALGPTFAAMAGFVQEATVAPANHIQRQSAPMIRASKAWSFGKLFRLRRDRSATAAAQALTPTLSAMAGFVNAATGTPSSK